MHEKMTPNALIVEEERMKSGAKVAEKAEGKA
jgi:hypothetical protein